MVDRFRLDGDWSRRLGIPAHITLVGPLPLSHPLPRGRLAELAAAADGVRFQLDSVDILGEAVCLLTDDARSLERLAHTIGVEPARASRLHLTIRRDRFPGALAEVREALEPTLPISCRVRELCLSRLLTADQVSVETL